MDEQDIISDILEELNRAKNKHPGWPDDPIHAAAVVAEESGELVQASLQWVYEGKDSIRMRDEAIQTGAAAIRYLLNMENYKRIQVNQSSG